MKAAHRAKALGHLSLTEYIQHLVIRDTNEPFTTPVRVSAEQAAQYEQDIAEMDADFIGNQGATSASDLRDALEQ